MTIRKTRQELANDLGEVEYLLALAARNGYGNEAARLQRIREAIECEAALQGRTPQPALRPHLTLDKVHAAATALARDYGVEKPPRFGVHPATRLALVVGGLAVLCFFALLGLAR